MPDYSLYAATLAAAGSSPNMYGGGNPGTSPGANSTMRFNNPNHLGRNTQTYGGGGAGQNNLSNLHQRTMSAMAGLGQGISQQFGTQQQNQASPNVAGSGSAPNTTGPQGGSPNYGLVGAAGFGQPGSPTSPYLANVSQHAHPHQGYPNPTSPAAQAMSAMSSVSGIPSTNTSTSVHTPISPATAYTPSFASPSLSQQAAFNAAAAAGLGVNFTAFGMANSQ
jgi:hypothetical protein